LVNWTIIGHGIDPTVEGPKLYKRNGYYYIFAPAGGVNEGWQIVLRSKNIYGPYERKVVLAQGKTNINGPHQGAWVKTKSGQSWFIHFQDKGAYGRVVLLEPMKWVKNWPLIGVNQDSENVGEPVSIYKKPAVGRNYPVEIPQTSDEFNSINLGLQWQWQANPGATWVFTTGYGYLRLYAQQLPEDYKNYWDVPNILMQKFPAEEFTATTKLTFKPLSIGDKAGFLVMCASYAYLSLTNKEDGIHLSFTTCFNADKGNAEDEHEINKVNTSSIYFRVKVDSGAVCHFCYSTDGNNFIDAGKPFTAPAGRWIGAKVGMFCTRKVKTNDSAYADFDWFRIEP
jgi:beta-xylosidase